MPDKLQKEASFGAGKVGPQLFNRWTFWNGGFGKGKIAFCSKCNGSPTGGSKRDEDGIWKCCKCGTLIEWEEKYGNT